MMTENYIYIYSPYIYKTYVYTNAKSYKLRKTFISHISRGNGKLRQKYGAGDAEKKTFRDIYLCSIYYTINSEQLSR